MRKRSTVYDEVFKNYLSLRNKQIETERKANEKIKEAEASISENESKMSAAIASGDQDSYVLAHTENLKNRATIDFFKETLKKIKGTNDADTVSESKELYHKADAEIARIKSEYAKEMCKALEPIIELSNNTLIQIELLELAKNKILHNLQHEPEKFRVSFSFNDIPMMRGLNAMLQSPDCIAELKSGQIAVNPESRTLITVSKNEWDSAAKKAFSEEAGKWV